MSQADIASLKSILASLLALLQALIGGGSAISQPLAPVPATTSTPVKSIILSAPTISSVTPASGPVGTTIVIHGANFTPTGNTVYASFATFSNLSSPDGQTLTLNVSSPNLNFPSNFASLKTVSFPNLVFRFYVKNANGQTLVPGQFKLEF